MSEQYPGGFITKDSPSVTTSSAPGMWTLSQAAGYQKQGLWPLPPFSSFTTGTQVNVATLQLQRSSVATLSASSFLYAYIGYNTGAGTANLYAVVATISGTTITFGTPVIIRSDLSPQGVGCCALSSTSALVTYGNTSSVWSGKALTISGTTITAGSETTAGTTASSGQCVPLTSTTALCIDNYGNKARVATVSGTSLSWGSETTFGSGANYGCVTSASSTTAVVARVSGGGVGLVATALTISGTTITAGTPTTIDASAGNEPFGICAVTPTSVIVAYLNTSSYLKANGITISGTTITVGTPSAPFTAYDANAANYDSGPIIIATSSSQALVASINQSTGHGLGQFLNISGTTVTSSGTSTILAASTRAPTVAYLGSGKAIAGYGQGTTNISAKVLTLA
jgi:hypothetical protein